MSHIIKQIIHCHKGGLTSATSVFSITRLQSPDVEAAMTTEDATCQHELMLTANKKLSFSMSAFISYLVSRLHS